MRKLNTDILIVGGGVGGCAAALAVCRAGFRVIMTEECDWLGGQLTAQAVPPDEHGWIEKIGCTATYRQYRNLVRDNYRQNYPLRPEVAKYPYFNPGNGWVSPLCHEPKVGLAVLSSMLRPHVTAERLLILLDTIPRAADSIGSDIITTVRFESKSTGEPTEIEARYIIDATENGDLLPLIGAEYITGAESREQTGEPDAKAQAQPDNVQAFSFCFVMDSGGDAPPKAAPANYSHWKNYIPKLNPPWPGPWLGWNGLNPRTMEVFPYRFDPQGEPPGPFGGLWGFRRILDRKLFTPGSFPSDLCLVNWPMIDYIDGHLLTGSPQEKERHLAAAREQSQAMFFWLQTEAPRPDGGNGWPQLRLRGDITGAPSGLAKMPYIREARRIKAEFTILQQHLAVSCRPHDKFAQEYPDSIGIGYYRIDLHPTSGGDNYLDVACQPFQIPLGALIPKRVENVLAGAKNIGTTHITNGCYRLHPIEWNIGEAAGELAAYCLAEKKTPRQVYRNRQSLRALQSRLRSNGFELEWPQDLAFEQGDPHDHAKYLYY